MKMKYVLYILQKKRKKKDPLRNIESVPLIILFNKILISKYT